MGAQNKFSLQDSCLQDLRTQICVCSEASSTTTSRSPAASQETTSLSTTTLPPTTIAPAQPSPIHTESVGPCFIKNERRVPDMPGSRRYTYVDSPEACQEYCRRID